MSRISLSLVQYCSRPHAKINHARHLVKMLSPCSSSHGHEPLIVCKWQVCPFNNNLVLNNCSYFLRSHASNSILAPTHRRRYHPGGAAELMRAAGADGTQLFNELHPWVNIERFLGKCYVGPLAYGGGSSGGGGGGSRGGTRASSTLQVPGPRAPRSSPLSRGAATSSDAQVGAAMDVDSVASASCSSESRRSVTLPLPRRSFYQTQDTAVIVLYVLSFAVLLTL